MAPTLRSKPQSSSTSRRLRPTPIRTHRAKSLGTGLDSITDISSPKLSPFQLGLITPSNVAICKACKTPIIKSPSPPVTPKLTIPPRNRLEAKLQSWLLQAQARAVNIQAAYASALKDFTDQGNNDLTTENQDLDFDNLPEEWRYVPWVATVCPIVGTLYGQLGRAMATSQRVIAQLQECLKAENKLLQEDPEIVPKVKRHFEDSWFLQQKAIRVEAAQPKKRKRNRN